MDLGLLAVPFYEAAKAKRSDQQAGDERSNEVKGVEH